MLTKILRCSCNDMFSLSYGTFRTIYWLGVEGIDVEEFHRHILVLGGWFQIDSENGPRLHSSHLVGIRTQYDPQKYLPEYDHVSDEVSRRL